MAPLNLSNKNPTQQSTHEAASTLESPSISSKEIQHRVQHVYSYIENHRLLINQLIKCQESAQRSLDMLSKQTLEEEQIQWVNIIWELDPSPANLNVKGTGAILTGGDGSGKTLAICFWLVKMRKDCPQLVVCTPGNLIHWKHELSKFPDIRAIVFVYDLWSDICEYKELRSRMSLSYSKLKDGNVVICELDSLNTKSTTSFSHHSCGDQISWIADFLIHFFLKVLRQ
jgi:SNF2 family DNA or RNA helicase